MTDLVAALNENSGAIVALTASVSLLLTVALLAEMRTTRNLGREAAVEARAKTHSPASSLLELRIRNYGPAYARDVAITYYLTAPGGVIRGERRERQETLLGAGEICRFLPGSPGGTSDLREMAAEGLTLHVEWQWNDARRRLWFFPARHVQRREWATAGLSSGFFDGWALEERDGDEDLHEIAEAARTIARHLADE